MTAADTAPEVREYWDVDAATYDHTPSHAGGTPVQVAAWRGELARLLPAAPARVLDVGAGTGFLSLLAAELGHRVTALDLSPGMLARLRAKAAARGLSVDVVEGDATAPPPGPFDAVLERHLLWTLPDPAAAVAAWRDVAPAGRLVLVESAWGAAADGPDRLRARGRLLLRRIRGIAPDHHGTYSASLQAALPLGGGTPIADLVELADVGGWGPARLHRLSAVDWAARRGLPFPERLLGEPARYAVVAGS